MATQNGSVVQFGTGTMVWTGGVVSGSTPAWTRDAGLTRDSQKVEVMDNDGDVQMQIFHAKKKTVNVTVIPYDTADVSDALTTMTAWTVASGVTASITSSIATALDGAYNVISSNTSMSQSGVAVVDLVLETFDDTTVWTATTA